MLMPGLLPTEQQASGPSHSPEDTRGMKTNLIITRSH